MIIESLENEKIKNLVKLQKRKYRNETNTYIVEGMHLVEEAYKANLIREIFLLEGEINPFKVPYTYITREVMKKVSSMDTPCSIIALCNKQSSNKIVGSHILLLDEIQDPGNLGTIIRSSVAFGIDTIILSENTVDLYNPKVLRATQGMYCYLNIIEKNAKVAIKELKDNNYIILGTNVKNGINIKSLDKDNLNKYCLIMGNEGNGVRKEIQKLCDKNLYIPLNDKVESLNVGIACSILLYELRSKNE